MEEKPEKIRVLLIEDEDADAEWTRRALAKSTTSSFELRRTERIFTGLECLKKESFDAILLDLHLPDGTGLEAFEKVHSQAPHLPVILLTGSLVDEKIALKVLEKGAQDYLLKGKFDDSMLVRSLLYALQRHKLQKELGAANQQLEKLNRLKDEFVATVSHELRTPLTAIKESASLMRDGVLGKVNKEQEDFLTTIDESVNRLAQLINNMLDLAKIEAGRMEFKRRKVSVKDLIKTTLKNYESITGNRKLKADLLEVPDVFADSDKILQVLGNLLSNAIKFTTDDGTITFTAQEQNGEAVITAQDNGTGIAKEDLPKLFQKFSQVGTAEKKTGGTGLGLALCKEIVESQKGRISATSELAKGSQFTFTLPVYTSKLALEESFAEQLEIAKSDGEESVGLIAMDSGIFRDHLEQVMERLRRGIHRTDTVLAVEPNWMVILATADLKGIEAMAKRLPDVLKNYAPQSLAFGTASYPLDGKDVSALLSKAKASVYPLYIGGMPK